MNKETSVHIPGCGDLKIKDVSFLPDPCPLPEELKKRALVEKERLIYAPFSGVGGIVYDKDAVYVELGGSHSHKEEDTGLVGALMNTQETLDEKLKHSELQLFSNTEPIKSEDMDENFGKYSGETVIDNGRVRRKVLFPNSETAGSSEDEDSEESDHEDDDDELEEDEEGDDTEELNNEGTKAEKMPEDRGTKRKKKSSQLENVKRKKKKGSLVVSNQEDGDLDTTKEETEDVKNSVTSASGNLEIYHSLSKESDIAIKNKITEALSQLNAGSNKFIEQTDSESESFDELSDTESRTGLEKYDSGKESDFQQETSEDEDYKEKKSHENEEEDEEMEDEEEVTDELKWKSNLVERAKEAYENRQRNNKNLMKIVYGVFDKSNMQEKKDEENEEDKDDDNEIGGIFRVVQEQQKQKIQERELQNQEESVFFAETPRDWLAEGNKVLVANRFVTGKWKDSEDAEELLKLDDMDDEELYGDFEDLETNEKHQAEAPKEATTTDEKEERRKLIEKKKKLKEQFDLEYDTGEAKTYYDELKLEVEKQATLNKSEFEGVDDNVRVQLEGYRPGMYVRVEIETVPCELITNLDPTYPLIIGGLLHAEENIGYVQTRIKKHRWYSKILKSKDPLILSIGWRRFQTLPIFSKLEDNLRNRMLKYTPEHVACMAHFWGPITPQSTGVVAIQDVATRIPGFRIAATGSIVEMDKSTQIMKKLKLTGVPLKIYKKTAFIKDMFNSSLEVAKFEGAKIKTVSGIRGQIKKAISKPEGCFRATFEDKILLSDIVFCRTWYKVDVPKFYNPVTSLLLPTEEKNRWQGMKTTGQLKREKNIRMPANTDSMYTPVEREEKVFKPLVIPRTLQKELPYKNKPKLKPHPGKQAPRFRDNRVAVIREPKEEHIAKVMTMIRTNYVHKQRQLKQATKQRIAALQSRIAAEEERKLKRQKEMKKHVFRELSKLEKKSKS